MRHLLVSGLITGLTLNIGEAALHGAVLSEAAKSAYARLNLRVSGDPMNLVLLVGLTFIQGMLMAWLYSVMRSRFRTRLRAATSAGLLVWVLSSLYAAVYLHAGFPGVLPRTLIWLPVVWQLFEYPLATLAGAATDRKE